MSSPDKRAEITDALMKQIRYSSINFVMFSQVVASKVGLHSTDNECLDFLTLNGPATAGQIAEFTGLTTGAVTAMIDRLEKAGFARREHDKADRRRVIVVPNVEKIMQEIGIYMLPMGIATEKLCQEFTEEELAVILKFLTKANDIGSVVIAETKEKSIQNAG
jgi:DNA-binding MarR family transcriptional regulator